MLSISKVRASHALLHHIPHQAKKWRSDYEGQEGAATGI